MPNDRFWKQTFRKKSHRTCALFIYVSLCSLVTSLMFLSGSPPWSWDVKKQSSYYMYSNIIHIYIIINIYIYKLKYIYIYIFGWGTAHPPVSRSPQKPLDEKRWVFPEVFFSRFFSARWMRFRAKLVVLRRYWHRKCWGVGCTMTYVDSVYIHIKLIYYIDM